MDERRDLVDREELRRRIAMVEAVARAIRDRSPQDTDGDFGGRLGAIRAARAVLSVPALRDALARDAQVRELDRMMAAAGATGIDLWRWESGDGWCAESDLCRSVIAEGATPSEALADLARQAKEVLGRAWATFDPGPTVADGYAASKSAALYPEVASMLRDGEG